MNPQQYPGQPSGPLPQGPPPDPNDPYAFIMNHGAQQPQKRMGLPRGNSTLQRVLIIAGGFLAILVVGLFAMSLFRGSGNRNAELLNLAQEQTEIIRIANLASSERAVRSTATQNLAANTSITVSTSKAQTLALISGNKPGEKTLALKKSTKTDTLLSEAAANNQYDSVFTETMTAKLKTYQADIKKLYTGNKSKKEKAVLESAYNGTVILLGEHTQPK